MSGNKKIDLCELGYAIFSALAQYQNVETLRSNGWLMGDIVNLNPPIRGCTKGVLVGQDGNFFHVRRIQRNGKSHQYVDRVPKNEVGKI